MPLKVVQSKQQIDFVVFQNSETALEHYASYFHVCKMDSAKDFCASHSNSHSSKSVVKEMHYSTLDGALVRNDCCLGTRVHKGLDRSLVYIDIYVKHRDLAEELRELLLSSHVVLLNKTFLDLFFDCLLSLCIVRVSVHQLGHSFLLFFLLIELSLEFLSN